MVIFLLMVLAVVLVCALSRGRDSESRPFFDERPEGDRFGTLR